VRKKKKFELTQIPKWRGARDPPSPPPSRNRVKNKTKTESRIENIQVVPKKIFSTSIGI